MSALASSIILDHVVPSHLAGSPERVERSDVWGRMFSFEPGQRYIVEASSGAGKSSLCSFIYGLRTDYSGSISVLGSGSVASLSVSAVCRLRESVLGWLPQQLGLFESLSALDNVLVKNRLTSFLPLSRIREMFECLDIAEKLNVPVRLLSVGQQQRVAVIRALAQPSRFLILDEPVSHLDPDMSLRVSQLIESSVVPDATIIATSVGNRLPLSSFTLLNL
ncbi:MAG: ATP-binding cassette domain-containing protein [Muribaculaceae bacterium]|nr:ATP-binding cassette domain-containing protein [Muribaculaceae bacterium]